MFLEQTKVISMMSLDMHLNWALKRTFFESKFNFSAELRINHLAELKKKIELKCVTYLFQYLSIKKQAFTNGLRLPTANYIINKQTKQIKFDNHCSTASLPKSLFHLLSKK